MTKMVLFDCDGVLINTEEIGYNILVGMLKDVGISYTREEYIELLSGITYAQFFENLARDYRAKKGTELPADFRAQVSSRLHAAEETQMRAIDGVVELLQNLKAHNIPFAVCSNSGAENLLRKLKQVGLYEYFTPHIYSRHHVDHPKPAPDMYLHAAANRGIDPKNCLVVEDSMTGTMAGLAAGMTVIGFVGESHRDSSEAQLLEKAGAKLIALSHEQTWDHIARFAGLVAKSDHNPSP